jgi:hypothetical protein
VDTIEQSSPGTARSRSCFALITPDPRRPLRIPAIEDYDRSAILGKRLEPAKRFTARRSRPPYLSLHIGLVCMGPQPAKCAQPLLALGRATRHSSVFTEINRLKGEPPSRKHLTLCKKLGIPFHKRSDSVNSLLLARIRKNRQPQPSATQHLLVR